MRATHKGSSPAESIRDAKVWRVWYIVRRLRPHWSSVGYHMRFRKLFTSSGAPLGPMKTWTALGGDASRCLLRTSSSGGRISMSRYEESVLGGPSLSWTRPSLTEIIFRCVRSTLTHLRASISFGRIPVKKQVKKYA